MRICIWFHSGRAITIGKTSLGMVLTNHTDIINILLYRDILLVLATIKKSKGITSYKPANGQVTKISYFHKVEEDIGNRFCKIYLPELIFQSPPCITTCICACVHMCACVCVYNLHVLSLCIFLISFNIYNQTLMILLKPQSTRAYDCIRLSLTWTGFWSDTIVMIASDFSPKILLQSHYTTGLQWSVVIVRLVRDHRIKVGGHLWWSQTSWDDLRR